MSRRKSFSRSRTLSDKEAQKRALATLARMRRKQMVLERAAKLEGISPEIVIRHVGHALRKRGRHYFAEESDAIPRPLYIPTHDGMRAVTVRDSRVASEISDHARAVKAYLRTGNTSALSRFRGRLILAGGRPFPYITDPNTLDKLAEAGALRLDDLYK